MKSAKFQIISPARRCSARSLSNALWVRRMRSFWYCSEKSMDGSWSAGCLTVALFSLPDSIPEGNLLHIRSEESAVWKYRARWRYPNKLTDSPNPNSPYPNTNHSNGSHRWYRSNLPGNTVFFGWGKVKTYCLVSVKVCRTIDDCNGSGRVDSMGVVHQPLKMTSFPC